MPREQNGNPLSGINTPLPIPTEPARVANPLDIIAQPSAVGTVLVFEDNPLDSVTKDD
jgi:hypothetical protein